MGRSRRACAHGLDFRLARNRAYASTLCTSNTLVVGGALNRSPTSSIILGLNPSEAASASSFVSQRLNDPNSFASSSPMKTIDLNPFRALYAAEATWALWCPSSNVPGLKCSRLMRAYMDFPPVSEPFVKNLYQCTRLENNPTGKSHSLRTG